MLQEINGSQSEKELVSRCLGQDRRAQRMLYEKYASRMYSLCLRYAGSTEEAEDLLQDGFITVFARMDSYSGNGSFEGWMRKIFVNTALMRLRKKDVLKGSEDVAEVSRSVFPEDGILEELEGRAILRLVSEMPAGFRTVFNLSVMEGFTHKEIAAALNISEGTSRSQLNRARIWLQDRIAKMEKR